MKSFKFLAIAAFGAMAFVACAKEDRNCSCEYKANGVDVVDNTEYSNIEFGDAKRRCEDREEEIEDQFGGDADCKIL